MNGIVRFLSLTLLTGLIMTGICIAEPAEDNNLSILALEASDLPTGYEISLPFGESVIDSKCDGNFCLVAAGNVWAMKSTDDANVSIGQEILVYSGPFTEDLLISAFNATYPDISGWVDSELKDPGLGDVSIAFGYTAPDDPNTDLHPLTGQVIAFAAGNVSEILVTIGEDNDSLIDLTEVSAGKLQTVFDSGDTQWKRVGSYRQTWTSEDQRKWEEQQARNAEEERIKRMQCIGYESCSGVW